jgi:hypothetical protein
MQVQQLARKVNKDDSISEVMTCIYFSLKFDIKQQIIRKP